MVAQVTSLGVQSKRDSVKHLGSLDGWRAVACVMVVFYHAGFSLHLGPLWVWGFTGVHLFFVLSGYLLFRPFCKAMRAGTAFGFRSFYIRRMLRIYPAYLLALAAYTLVRYATGQYPPSLRNLVLHLLMAFNSPDQREFHGINVAFWTLAIEAQFYALLPLIAFAVYRVLNRRPNPAIFGAPLLILLVGLVSRAFELQGPMRLGTDHLPAVRVNTIFSFLDFFGCGMLVAAIENAAGASGRLRWQTACAIAMAGLSVFLGANLWAAQPGNDDWVMGTNLWFFWLCPFLLCAGAAALLFVVVRFDGFPSTLLASRPLVFIGEASYSIYLFHVLIQLLLAKLPPLAVIANPALRGFLRGLISLVPAMAVGRAVYRLVELPCLQLSGRLKSSAARIR